MIQDFLFFIRNPKLSQIQKSRWHLIILLLFHFAVLIVASNLLGFFFDSFSPEYIKEPKPNISTGKNPIALILVISSLGYLLSSVKEEFKYRYFLGGYNERTIRISAALILSDALVVLTYYFLNLKSNEFIYYGIVVMGAVVVFIIFSLYTKRYNISLSHFYEKNYVLLMYLSITLFAVWHIPGQIGRYDTSVVNIFISHFISGLIYTFVRVRYGIATAISYHFAHNVPFIAIEAVAIGL